jgi:hypothetical protein
MLGKSGLTRVNGDLGFVFIMDRSEYVRGVLLAEYPVLPTFTSLFGESLLGLRKPSNIFRLSSNIFRLSRAAIYNDAIK